METVFDSAQLDYLKTRKVLICTPFYMSNGFSQYFSCLLNTIRALDKIGIESDFLSINGSSYVDHARNVAAKQFLFDYPDYTDLFFIDSDMEWDVIGFLRVLAAQYPLVGAAYPMKNVWGNFSVRHYVNEDQTPLCTEDGLIEARYVPGGFMKITHECLTDMRQRYYLDKQYKDQSGGEPLVSLFECVVKEGLRYGEDTEFCRKWLAMGNKIYCEPRITFSHYGTQAWTGNYHEFLLSRPKPVRTT
jgi:hypothetical protein